MVFHQTLFNDMGNIRAILLSGKKAGYKIACALAMLVTSRHESTAHYRKENLPQEPRVQNPKCSLLFPLTFISVHTESTWHGHRGALLPAFSPSSSFPIVPSVFPALLFPSVMLYKFLHKSQAHLLLDLSPGIFQVGLLFSKESFFFYYSLVCLFVF